MIPRVISEECLMALRGGVWPTGRGNSGGDAIDQEARPFDIITCGDREGQGIMGEIDG